MCPEQFRNAKNVSRHHGSSTKITLELLCKARKTEIQFTKKKKSDELLLPKKPTGKIKINKFLLYNIFFEIPK